MKVITFALKLNDWWACEEQMEVRARELCAVAKPKKKVYLCPWAWTEWDYANVIGAISPSRARFVISEFLFSNE